MKGRTQRKILGGALFPASAKISKAPHLIHDALLKLGGALLLIIIFIKIHERPITSKYFFIVNVKVLLRKRSKFFSARGINIRRWEFIKENTLSTTLMTKKKGLILLFS